MIKAFTKVALSVLLLSGCASQQASSVVPSVALRQSMPPGSAASYVYVGIKGGYFSNEYYSLVAYPAGVTTSTPTYSYTYPNLGYCAQCQRWRRFFRHETGLRYVMTLPSYAAFSVG